MPGKRASLFPLLLPAVICVPLAAVVIFFLVDAWHASDARAAADKRRADAALRAEMAYQETVRQQGSATGLLSRSTLVWLWVKFQGEHLTASNRFHADISLAEIANYASFIRGATVYLASAKTGLLYRDGAPVRALRATDPQDRWYFDALKTDALLTVTEGSVVRTSARIMDESSLLGVVSLVCDAATIGADIFPPALAERGITAALTDPQGGILAVTALGGTSARTVAELFPGANATTLQSALRALVKEGALSTFEATQGGKIIGVTAVRAAPTGGAIVVAAEIPSGMPWLRIVLLAVVPAASLALIVAALSVMALRRMGSLSSLLDRRSRESESARTAFTRIDASARSAQSAAVNLRALAGSIVGEASAGVTSAGEARALFAGSEEQDAELRAGITGRLSLLDRLADSIHASLAQSRGAQAALLSVGPDAGRAEEDIGRIITLGSAAASAVDRAAKGVESLLEASGKLNLLAVNAALEAVKAGPAGQGLSRVADQVKGFADDASSRARMLQAALAEAVDRLADATAAAQQAGKLVHAAAAAAEGVATGPTGAWEETSTLIAKAEGAGVSAARLQEQADHSDRGRSALEGMTKILTRIRELAARAADLAGSVASDTESAARTAAAVMENYDRPEKNR